MSLFAPETNPTFEEIVLVPWHDVDRPAAERPLLVDPFAWSASGRVWPDRVLVRRVDSGRCRELEPTGKDRRGWQAVCAGPSGAKAERQYLEADADGTFDATGLRTLDVLQVGQVRYGRRRTSSIRTHYVVVASEPDRIALTEVGTGSLAATMRYSNELRAMRDERAERLRVRQEWWDDARREKTAIEAMEDDAIAGAWL